jgi:hypothetical protein
MQSTFCLKENIPSSEAKWGRTQQPNATLMHLVDDLDQVEKTGRVTTLNELAYNLMSAFILAICFILLPFKARHPVLYAVTTLIFSTFL